MTMRRKPLPLPPNTWRSSRSWCHPRSDAFPPLCLLPFVFLVQATSAAIYPRSISCNEKPVPGEGCPFASCIYLFRYVDRLVHLFRYVQHELLTIPYFVFQ
jgi:hypothetical protein